MASATRGNSVFDFYGKGLTWDFLYEPYGPLVSGHSRYYKPGAATIVAFHRLLKKPDGSRDLRKPKIEVISSLLCYNV